MSRTHSKNRCPRCWLRQDLCLCAEIPRLATRTRVLVLAHYLELNTSTNTGRLAHLALQNSDLRTRGEPGEVRGTGKKTDLTDVVESADAGGSSVTLLLYPGPGSVELTPQWVSALHAEGPKQVTLVVPDGSWRQASKVQNREPGLAHAIRVRLAPGPLSEFRLRREPNPEAVCTIEAIARALGVLEGAQGPAIRAALEQLLRTMVHRTLLSRGVVTASASDGDTC